MMKSLILISLFSLALASRRPAAQSYVPKPLPMKGIPLLGFGTWNLDRSNASEAVSWAIQLGYRHIDCAEAYGNEFEVGNGIRDGLEKTGLTRDDLWITSKLWNNRHDPDRVEEALMTTLAHLQIPYLDLWHMHWPVAESPSGKHNISYHDTWAAMVKLQNNTKRIRHLGVSNFSPYQLGDLLNHTKVIPDVHQMELHPYLQQSDFLDMHKKLGIHVTAYSPLAGSNPTYHHGETDEAMPPALLTENGNMAKIAWMRKCTTAQVALMWGMSRGTSVIPKSQHPERIWENLHSVECVLQDDDLDLIHDMGKYRYRYNNPSKGWGVDLYEGLEDSLGKHKKHS